MMVTRLLMALALFGTAGFALAQSPSVRPTQLTSTDGKSLTALILGASGGSVVLQREDRRKFTVPMSRFDIVSQRTIAASLFSGYEVIPMPEIGSRYFRPRGEKQEEMPANVYLMTAHSEDKWWPILHVGDFSDEPLSFRSVQFQNKGGASVEFPVPLNADFEGAVPGGKRWRAVQFAVDEGKLRELGEIAADPKDLTAHGVTAKGERIEIPAKQLDYLGSSVSVHLMVREQVDDPEFLAKLPPVEPVEDVFVEPSRSSDTILRMASGIPADGPVRRFTIDCRAEVVGGNGETRLVPFSRFQIEDCAELMSRLLESRYRFNQSATTNMEYLKPNYWENSWVGEMIPNLEFGRVIGSWRPNLWLRVPLTDPSSDTLERIRVFVDDEPGFALTDVSVIGRYTPEEGGKTYYRTSFHAGQIMGGSQFEVVRNARRIRFELVKGTQVFVVDAKPGQVAQMREAAVQYQLMWDLERAGAKVRPLL